MIRKRPGEGFLRRPPGPLARVLVIGALAAAPVLSRPASAPSWWEIRLAVTAKGAYGLRGGGALLSGEYTFRARFEGRLNPDGDDFLLVHLKSETLEWSLRESAGQGEAESVLEAPGTPPPVLRLNYVLKEKDEIELDFEIESTTVPLHGHPLEVPLEMPRSTGRVGDKPGYGDFILSGSNRIVLPASDLVRRRPERTFAWSWGQTKRLDHGSQAFVATQSHSVEAAVTLIRH
jgi:hypothetical protein